MPVWSVGDYHGGSRLMRDFIELPFLEKKVQQQFIIVGVQWKWATFSITVQATGIVALTHV